ncbi:MAG: hypothetical protein HZA15_15995 [Nitrospirae bacterium]|nr:hypothetical protein [Nitrospirota bacterium]
MDVRERGTRNIVCALLLIILVASCAPAPLIKKEETYAPIEASLAHINQKVAGHFLDSGVPDGFDAVQYRAAIEQVCFPNPYCKTQAVGIFDSFGIKARKVDDMFSVMLCDKDLKWKIMEDFSCNNLRVEIQSWRIGENVPCEPESDWQRVIKEFCE